MVEQFEEHQPQKDQKQIDSLNDSAAQDLSKAESTDIFNRARTDERDNNALLATLFLESLPKVNSSPKRAAAEDEPKVSNFSFKDKSGKEQEIKYIVYNDKGLVVLFRTPSDKVFFLDTRQNKWKQMTAAGGQALDAPQLGNVVLKEDGLHCSGKDADIAARQLDVPIIDDFDKSGPVEKCQKQYGYVKALEGLLMGEEGLLGDKDKNGLLSKNEIVSNLDFFRHNSEGYFGVKQIVQDKFDQLASSPNGLSRQAIEKALKDEQMDCFINYIQKSNLSLMEKSNIASLFHIDFSDRKKANQLANDINSAIKAKGLKSQVSFSNIESHSLFEANRIMNIINEDGVLVHQIPCAALRIR